MRPTRAHDHAHGARTAQFLILSGNLQEIRACVRLAQCAPRPWRTGARGWGNICAVVCALARCACAFAYWVNTRVPVSAWLANKYVWCTVAMVREWGATLYKFMLISLSLRVSELRRIYIRFNCACVSVRLHALSYGTRTLRAHPDMRIMFLNTVNNTHTHSIKMHSAQYNIILTRRV